MMIQNIRSSVLTLFIAVPFAVVLSQDMVPQPRFGHTFTTVGSFLYLYGGYSSGDSASYLSDLQRYDPSENVWSVAQSITEPPPGRATHAAAACEGLGVPEVYLGITCGTGASGEVNDLWVYYPEEQTWTQEPQNGLEIPSPRTDHIAVCIDSELYVYGGRGCCGTGVRGDLWVYDLETETWEERQEYEPRYGHSVALYADKMYVYGGLGTELYDNIIIYDPEDDSWKPIEPQEQVPPARRLHASAYNGSKMWIIGGLGEAGPLNDTWEYDFAANTWVQKADAPSLSRAAAALNANSVNQIFLFGGLDAALSPTNELWRYDASVDEWEELEPVGGSEPPLVVNYEMSARPNPFRQQTSFLIERRFRTSDQRVLIHDIRGNLVTALTIREERFGNSEITWEGTDSSGQTVAPGVYQVSTAGNGSLKIIKLP